MINLILIFISSDYAEELAVVEAELAGVESDLQALLERQSELQEKQSELLAIIQQHEDSSKQAKDETFWNKTGMYY